MAKKFYPNISCGQEVVRFEVGDIIKSVHPSIGKQRTLLVVRGANNCGWTKTVILDRGDDKLRPPMTIYFVSEFHAKYYCEREE